MEELIQKEIKWSGIKKFFFRFVFIYAILYCLPFPLYLIPGTDSILESYSDIYHSLAIWFGKIFFGLDITIFTNGSGDTTYDYVLVFSFVIISISGSIFWGLIDRSRNNYIALSDKLRIFVRYYLAFFLFSYGFVKIIKTQFPFPTLGRLQQPYGESSPMGLAWTFLGYSEGYNYFMGFSEALAGVFLFFKRTTLLGGLLTMAVMGNVAVMNFCFDIPVKLFSLHLFLFAFLLVFKDLKPLFNFFVKNENSAPKISPPLLKSGLIRKAVFVLKMILIVWLIYTNISEAYQYVKTDADKPPLFGIYKTGTFILNNDTVKTTSYENKSWKTLTLDRWDRASLRLEDTTIRFTYYADTIRKKIQFAQREDSTKTFELDYNFVNDNIQFIGSYFGDSINIVAAKKSDDDFLLVKRGFHWINEYPFNR